MTSREANISQATEETPKKAKEAFRSDFLNNHPIMMEYLAAGVVNRDQRDEEEVAAEKRAEAERKRSWKNRPHKRPAEESAALLSIDFVVNLI